MIDCHMSPETALLALDVRRVIMQLFGTTSPWGFVWTSESLDRARALAAAPELPNDFFYKTQEILRERLGAAELFYENQTTGHAIAVGARPLSSSVTFHLLVCSFYPVATVRACTAPGPGEGLDDEWHLQLSDLDAARSVDAAVAALANPEGPLHCLVRSHGYIFAPPDAQAFQQWIRSGLFVRRKAWDYLFYLGVPTG